MVHPHIRGAYRVSSCILSAASGSSPHTWGILNPADYADMTVRFIPTYVGHTPVDCRAGQRPSVHPHIRGAYAGHGRHTLTSVGSSPHTWGILVAQSADGLEVRFIPTYVGHTSAPGTAPKGCPVHPHIRGAYVDMMHQISRHGGSSPHTWGIPAPPPGIYATPRFIPTYVGHTKGLHF